MGGQALVLGKCSSWISIYHLLWSQMFFLCDSCGLRALQTLIQSQHYFNLLLCRWLIRNLVCIFLYFFHQEGFICDLNNQDSFIFSPLFSGFLPDSVLILSGGCSKKLPLLLQSLRKEKRWQLFLFSSKIKTK